MFRQMVAILAGWFKSEPVLSLKETSELKAKLLYLKNRRRYDTELLEATDASTASNLRTIKGSLGAGRRNNASCRNSWSIVHDSEPSTEPAIAILAVQTATLKFEPVLTMHDASRKLEELLRTGADHFTAKD